MKDRKKKKKSQKNKKNKKNKTVPRGAPSFTNGKIGPP